MSQSFSFNILGNRYPSAAERAVVLDAIQRDENRLESVKGDIQASEEQWRVAHKAFEGVNLILEDAKLRLRAILSLKKVTSDALETLNKFALDKGDDTRMEDAPATGNSHLAITNRALKQQDKTKRALSDRIAALLKAEETARAAVANEEEAYNVAQVQLCGLGQDLDMYRDQVMALEASILAKKRRFSSVRKVVTETWLQIFRFVAFSPPLLSSGVHCKSAIANPVHPLSHVCKSWDAILSDNPSLWGCFYIKTLALDDLDIRYLKNCLKHTNNEIILLHLRTLVVVLPPQARVISDIFKTYTVNKLEIRASADCAEAVAYLIDYLPTPIALLIHNEDSVEQQQKARLILRAQLRQSERLRTVTLNDALLRTQSKHLRYGSVEQLQVDLHQPLPITPILGESYNNVTTLTITGCNFSRRKTTDQPIFTFPRLRRITGPIMGLMNIFDALCQMPALCEIGTWVMDGKRPGLSAWRLFLDRDGLRNRLEMIEIQDMDSVDAVSIVKYVRELCSVPRMVLAGRSVDVIAQQLVDPNRDGQNLEVQALVVQNYEGDGVSILNLVTSYNLGPTSHALRIEEVIWDDCCNVIPQMRKDIDQICQE
jgi:hypothetical protein